VYARNRARSSLAQSVTKRRATASSSVEAARPALALGAEKTVAARDGRGQASWRLMEHSWRAAVRCGAAVRHAPTEAEHHAQAKEAQPEGPELRA